MLKIAFATSDGSAVDQHFGWCRRFDVYEVSAQSARLLETRLLPPAAREEDSKIESRLASVRDCAILNVCDIGGSAAAKVVAARVHPLKVPRGTPVEDLIGRLQGVLAGTPPPWLRKVLRQHSPDAVPAWAPTGGMA
ncbi:MAG: nitrogen fixation protein NifX [Frankia sp.]|nr:nitrogen fixation protein NifX [Frankia sp.]